MFHAGSGKLWSAQNTPTTRSRILGNPTSDVAGIVPANTFITSLSVVSWYCARQTNVEKASATVADTKGATWQRQRRGAPHPLGIRLADPCKEILVICLHPEHCGSPALASVSTFDSLSSGSSDSSTSTDGAPESSTDRRPLVGAMHGGSFPQPVSSIPVAIATAWPTSDESAPLMWEQQHPEGAGVTGWGQGEVTPGDGERGRWQIYSVVFGRICVFCLGDDAYQCTRSSCCWSKS